MTAPVAEAVIIEKKKIKKNEISVSMWWCEAMVGIPKCERIIE